MRTSHIGEPNSRAAAYQRGRYVNSSDLGMERQWTCHRVVPSGPSSKICCQVIAGSSARSAVAHPFALQTTSGLKTVAAATWYRLGALFDPAESDPTHRVKIYIEDAIVGYLTDTNLAAATFPSAVLQTFGFGIKNQTNVAKSWDIDCAAIAMAA